MRKPFKWEKHRRHHFLSGPHVVPRQAISAQLKGMLVTFQCQENYTVL
jgi:hypothetical protein